MIAFSLLYPSSIHSQPARVGHPDVADLGLARTIQALDIDGRHQRFLGGILGALETDPAIIRYRQQALAELLNRPQLLEQFAAVLPQLDALAEAGPGARWNDNTPLPLVGVRLADLNGYVAAVEQLFAALEQADKLHAAAWLGLRAMLQALRDDEQYQQLIAELPSLRAQLEHANSVTIGINLDSQLQPESATVVSINPYRFGPKNSLAHRLLGDRHSTDLVRGITALYKANEGDHRTPEHELFRDMTRLLERVAAPIASVLARFVQINAAPLIALTGELVFYIGAARLLQRLKEAGLPCCFPEITAAEERSCLITDAYNLDLALRVQEPSSIVPNTICFEDDAMILLLTGPNSGGKTTYARAIGQIQVLAQAGLFVPGSNARISPVDGIFSHFATAERPGGSGGRLAEELERIAQIMANATPNSLLIFNEPLSSTDERSARLLARDLLAGLRVLGARVIFITHLYELVDELIPTGVANNGIVSMVATLGREHNGHVAEAPTYHIAIARPQASEYARELAERYGLSRMQLEQALTQRLDLPTATKEA